LGRNPKDHPAAITIAPAIHAGGQPGQQQRERQMLWETIGRVVDDHRCRAGARRMSAALVAGREDGLMSSRPAL
jgi:hypothetical protein